MNYVRLTGLGINFPADYLALSTIYAIPSRYTIIDSRMRKSSISYPVIINDIFLSILFFTIKIAVLGHPLQGRTFLKKYIFPVLSENILYSWVKDFRNHLKESKYLLWNFPGILEGIKIFVLVVSRDTGKDQSICLGDFQEYWKESKYLSWRFPEILERIKIFVLKVSRNIGKGQSVCLGGFQRYPKASYTPGGGFQENPESSNINQHV